MRIILAFFVLLAFSIPAFPTSPSVLAEPFHDSEISFESQKQAKDWVISNFHLLESEFAKDGLLRGMVYFQEAALIKPGEGGCFGKKCINSKIRFIAYIPFSKAGQQISFRDNWVFYKDYLCYSPDKKYVSYANQNPCPEGKIPADEAAWAVAVIIGQDGKIYSGGSYVRPELAGGKNNFEGIDAVPIALVGILAIIGGIFLFKKLSVNKK